MSPMRFIFKYKFQIALVIGILLLLGGCKEKEKSESAELKAMKESSIAITQLTKGREVSRNYQDREVNPPLGKPKEPGVRILYEPINNFTQEDVYGELIGNLGRNNWQKVELSAPQVGYYKASFPQENFTIVAEVLIHSNSNIVSVHLRTTSN